MPEQNPRTVEVAFDNTFTTATLAAKLSSAVAALQGALADVAREERETQSARAARNQAEERFRATISNIAAILEAHMRLAGLAELADRIRPTYARTSGEASAADSAAPAAGDGQDGQPSDQPSGE